jgi:hypothetical protein
MSDKGRPPSGFSFDRDQNRWEGRMRVPWWSTEPIDVWMEMGDEGPSGAHWDALRAITAYGSDLRLQFERKVHEYYTANTLDDNPTLASPSHIWKLLEPATLVVLPSKDDSVVFLLIMECQWDSEHGLGVRFKNGSIVDIGGQGDVSYDE